MGNQLTLSSLQTLQDKKIALLHYRREYLWHSSEAATKQHQEEFENDLDMVVMLTTSYSSQCSSPSCLSPGGISVTSTGSTGRFVDRQMRVMVDSVADATQSNKPTMASSPSNKQPLTKNKSFTSSKPGNSKSAQQAKKRYEAIRSNINENYPDEDEFLLYVDRADLMEITRMLHEEKLKKKQKTAMTKTTFESIQTSPTLSQDIPDDHMEIFELSVSSSQNKYLHAPVTPTLSVHTTDSLCGSSADLSTLKSESVEDLTAYTQAMEDFM